MARVPSLRAAQRLANCLVASSFVTRARGSLGPIRRASPECLLASSFSTVLAWKVSSAVRDVVRRTRTIGPTFNPLVGSNWGSTERERELEAEKEQRMREQRTRQNFSALKKEKIFIAARYGKRCKQTEPGLLFIPCNSIFLVHAFALPDITKSEVIDHLFEDLSLNLQAIWKDTKEANKKKERQKEADKEKERQTDEGEGKAEKEKERQHKRGKKERQKEREGKAEEGEGERQREKERQRDKKLIEDAITLRSRAIKLS
uniref:Uncharacterized protein n=1 Tax=Fagus sylvatica TaxID=28930 RepID=A0A2N9GY25_FAGSY